MEEPKVFWERLLDVKGVLEENEKNCVEELQEKYFRLKHSKEDEEFFIMEIKEIERGEYEGIKYLIFETGGKKKFALWANSEKIWTVLARKGRK